jgi:CBS domain containing-hemolysin-like protein
VNKELDLKLPESDDYETVAGLLIEKLRRIPALNEIITIGGNQIEIVAATDRAIETVRITRKKK